MTSEQNLSAVTGYGNPNDRRSADDEYVRIISNILRNGDTKGDRTGVGTKAVWGETVRFNLADGSFPIITSKRVFWKTAVKEMLLFIKGATHLRDFLEQNVKVWTDWPLKRYKVVTGDRDMSQDDFEAKIMSDPEFSHQWGDLGPIYGKQWRRWLGADGREYDQLYRVIETIKNNPNDRRIILEGWKVDELDEMTLPPCHKTYQFQVTSSGRLNSFMMQRSADCALGVPFNWVGQAALHLMIAKTTDLIPNDMLWVGTDVHLYSNTWDAVAQQIERSPRPQALMDLKVKRDRIEDYVIEDFELTDYEPHGKIDMDVAV